MNKKIYDTAKFAVSVGDSGSLDSLKITMLEAIGNIAVAVRDKDADLAVNVQTDLLWVYEVFGTIEEREVEI